MKTDRLTVYSAIDSERDYQKMKWGNNKDDPTQPIESYACYVQEYTNQLVKVCGTTNDYPGMLAAMRKVAALCVACMEQHGAPRREGF